MKKITAILVAGLLMAGCIKKDQQGIGVVPLEGAKVTGKVVEAAADSGVLLKTSGGRTALLPDDWEYRQDNKEVAFGNLSPGQTVTAYAPSGTGRLVAAPGKNLVLANDQDTFVLPMEAFPTAVHQVPVRVQAYGGQTWVMPLEQAIYSDGYTVLSHPSYADYQFAQAQPYSVARAYPVGTYDQQPLALVPASGGMQLMSLPSNYYPVQNLQTNQPVRFSYYDNNVSVSSWDSLQDGQLSLGKLLLAGTLLKLLPGQAMVQVGAQPVMVPRSYIYQNGYPVAWNTIQPGAPINVQYYPGVYNVVDYSNDLFTFSYNNSMVQLPVRYMPDSFYRQPVAVRYVDGKRKRMPYGQAKKLVAANGVRMMAYSRPPADWKTRFHYAPSNSSYVVYNHPTSKAYRHDKGGQVVFGSSAPSKKWYGANNGKVKGNKGHGKSYNAAPRHAGYVAPKGNAKRNYAAPKGNAQRGYAAPKGNSKRSYAAPKGNAKHYSQAPQARRSAPRQAKAAARPSQGRRAASYSAPVKRQNAGPSRASHGGGGGKAQARGGQGQGGGKSGRGHGRK